MLVEDAALAQAEALSAVNDVFRNLSLLEVSQEAADSLVSLAGGISEFAGLTSNFVDTFFSDQEREDLALSDAIRDVSAFNADLGLTGDDRIDTQGEIRDLFDQLNADIANNVDGADQQLIDLLSLTDSFAIIAQQTNGLDDAISRLPEALQLAFINPDAANDPAFDSGNVGSLFEPSEESARQSEELQQIRQALADLSATTLEGNAQSDRSRQELIAALTASIAAAQRLSLIHI